MSGSLLVDFDNDPAARYEVTLRPDDADEGDGVVLAANQRACLALARLFNQLAEGASSHVHLGYTEQEPQGPGFRILVDPAGRVAAGPDTETNSADRRGQHKAPITPGIIPGKWKEVVLSTPEQSLWLDLLEEDVVSAEISFAEYAAAASRLPQLRGDQLAQVNAKAMHFAKSFVSAARRVWWVIETADLKHLPAPVADMVKLQRKKKKAFFEIFIEPRNALEHASAEVKEPNKHLVKGEVFLNPKARTWHPIIARLDLRHSMLTLASGPSAPVTKSALEKILDCHKSIVDTVLSTLPRRTNQMLLLGPVDTKGWDE